MQGCAWGGWLRAATFHAGAWVLCSLPLAKAAEALTAGKGCSVTVSESTPQSRQLRLTQSLSCSRGCWGKAVCSSFKSKKGHRRSSCFNLCQSVKHLQDLPWPTPFRPQRQVHSPPSLVCRRRGDTGQARAGKKQSQCLHQPRHEPLDAAEGALDCSCHLVSSFGSESQLTADLACSAGENASLPSPHQPALLSQAHLDIPMQGEGRAGTTGEGINMELRDRAVRGWQCCSENYRHISVSSGGTTG